MLWTSVQILLAIPPLTAALVMILLDRQLGAHFFDVQNGGSAYLWQHLFWFFGHPEVYILILPVFGMVSEVIPVFSRKVLFGYEFMAVATMAIAFISLGVWAHHMFTVGMSRTLDLFFAAASLLVSIPTGIKFFNWLATMYGGRLSFASPMLFACGFLSLFLIGGLTGIMLAAAPFDFQLSDSYFVVGHFHWVLIGGTLFGTFAGHPLLVSQGDRAGCSPSGSRAGNSGCSTSASSSRSGRCTSRGCWGCPGGSTPTSADRGWAIWNQLATLGAFIQVPSFAIFVVNIFWSLRDGKPAGDDPWDAWTLEWTTTSPPPAVQLRDDPDGPQPPAALGPEAPRRPGLDSTNERQTRVVSEPLPPASPTPPSPELDPEPGQWGMVAFLVSEVAFFSTLIVVYLTFLGKDTVGPTPREALSLPLVIGTTICLLSSSATIHRAERRLRPGDASGFRTLVGGHDRPGLVFLLGHGLRVVRADHAARPDDQPQPVRDARSTPWSASTACT